MMSHGSAQGTQHPVQQFRTLSSSLETRCRQQRSAGPLRSGGRPAALFSCHASIELRYGHLEQRATPHRLASLLSAFVQCFRPLAEVRRRTAAVKERAVEWGVPRLRVLLR